MQQIKKRFDELDGLKIFFALGVVLYHYWAHIAGHKVANCPKLSAFVYCYGYLGVEFFFILSGFLMEHTYKKIIDNFNFFGFMGRRLKSLYAPYLCAECFGILVCFLDYVLSEGEFVFYTGKQITVENIVRSFSMSWSNWNRGGNPFMNSTWFINVLVLCYALYFAVLCFCKRFKISPLYIYIALMLFAWGFNKMGANFPFLLNGATRGYWCFFVGCILYNIFKSGIFNKKGLILLLDFILLLFLLVGHRFGIPEIFGDVQMCFIFFVFPVLILTVENLKFAKQFFSCKVLTFLSKFSMDIYLSHMAIIWLAQIFNKYFEWNLDFSKYSVLGIILLAVFVLAFVWHYAMAKITPAFNRLFLHLINSAKPINSVEE